MKPAGDPSGDAAFRREVAQWLDEHLQGEYEQLRFRGGPGDEHMFFDARSAWERELAVGGWIGIAWPEAHGGRELSLSQQVVFHEEYARAGGPGRVGHIGEMLLAPTLLAFGSEEQCQRFLPPIREGRELWCQGYSEPGAGSDLAAVRTKARLDEASGEWVLEGQKVWTSLAQEADWCFVLARSEEGSKGRHGLSYLLVPMSQDGIEVRPIQQLTGTSEFNEVFFDGARTAADNIVGAPGEGWQVAMGTLGFERGVSTLGQQMQFTNEFGQVLAVARRNGALSDPVMRQRLARSWAELQIMRYNALRVLSSGATLSPEAMISKLYWATWHRDFGALAMAVLGPQAELLEEDGDYQLSRLQSIFLFSRSDTIYAGTNQIQRNIIAERALGMPREPRGEAQQ